MYLSVVVPVYKEEENISEFVTRTTPVLKSLTRDFEIIFVLDPSPDRSEELIQGFAACDPAIKLLKLSRRFGQPMATQAGLHYSSGDVVVVMDVDLQDPPELIPQMVEKWRQGFDVVYAQRTTREGGPISRTILAHFFYKVLNRIADVQIPENTGDFRLMSRRVVDQICQLKESHGFLRGLVAFVGYPQTAVLFSRPGRHAGATHYNQLFGSIRIALNGLIGFSGVLLNLSTTCGFVIGALSLVTGFAYMVAKLMGVPFPIGNPTIVILVLFMGSIQLINIGIVGEYIYRIYEEVRHRPKFIVDQALGFDETEIKKDLRTASTFRSVS